LRKSSKLKASRGTSQEGNRRVDQKVEARARVRSKVDSEVIEIFISVDEDSVS